MQNNKVEPLDLLIKGATVVDGSGVEPFVANVGVRAGRIVYVGNSGSAATETIDATGCWLTPGFVDIHTHYDGQATWDECFTPSIFHGVTTVMMGNCGVGFAPKRPGAEDALIKLMEGVEDIPGAALHEGIRWDWESFPQYMDALAKTPRSLDYLVQVPHDPLRMYVMGERAVAKEVATPQDIEAMRELLREALKAGAAGFSTGRSDNHRTSEGKETPAAEAGATELKGIAKAFDGVNHGVVQMVNDFDLLRGVQDDAAGAAKRFNAEFDLIEQLARAAGRPLSMTWLQRDPGGKQFEAIQQRVEAAFAAGLPLYLQTAARGIGVINGLDASFHPFMGAPAYKEVAHLPLAERAASLRDPIRKARVLCEKSDTLAGDGTAVPPLVDILLQRIDLISARMFPLQGELNYEPSVMQSFLVPAKQRGIKPLEAIFDYLCAGDGSNLLYFPIFNYNDGNLDVIRQMLAHPRGLFGLSDAGAHVGTVCDASVTTFMLTHWVRDRAKDKLSLAQAVEMMTRRNARYLGLNDRGLIAVGLRADLNLIDPERLSMGTPKLVHDLPAGGKRFVQKAQGYIGTWVNGERVQSNAEITAARPGRLVRMGA